ncbi:DMT family transporter [Actinomycetospora sp. TBRC 11914]|uniref:DMT family transporter n=1 Tax=Actinomycetospora sp. TBRC 11914 TaxID=2729387 RepID=UPI00145E770E|nr:EamA family transporter [Actinomycetospora sp. TBRC 11914]NMO93733.1 EamA family transporter [Actinomycetospora sp. TBRC 11914]
MLRNTPTCYEVPVPTPTRSPIRPRLVGLGLVTAFVLVWTSGYLVGDLGTGASPPLTLIFWRFLLATAVIGTIALVTGAPWPARPRDWLRPAAAGILLQTVQFAGIYDGLALGVSAGLASLIVSASPLVIAVVAVGLDGERLRPAGRLGLAVGLAGVGVAVSAELSGGARAAGILFVVLGLAGFVAGTVLQKHAPVSADLRSATTIQMGAATLTSLPLAAVSGGFALPLTATAIGSVVWLAVVNSVGGLLLLFVLLRRRSGAGATSYLFLVPPVTALLAVPVLAQPLHLAALAGVALAAVGVGLVSRSELRPG